MAETQILENKTIHHTAKIMRATNMNVLTVDESPEVLFRSAISEIRCGNYGIARNLLKTAAKENIENPEIYNLLGISYEMEGDRLKASKFYRVSYYMDQNFAPASANLERVCKFMYKGSRDICWGIYKNGDKNL